jgi:hypothetical protein
VADVPAARICVPEKTARVLSVVIIPTPEKPAKDVPATRICVPEIPAGNLPEETLPVWVRYAGDVPVEATAMRTKVFMFMLTSFLSLWPMYLCRDLERHSPYAKAFSLEPFSLTYASLSVEGGVQADEKN